MFLFENLTNENKIYICNKYKSGSFVKDIAKEFAIDYRHIKRVLQEANIEILNYSKRVTPKYVFKKGQIAHNKGLTLENQYGDKASDIRQKMGAARRGKTYENIFGLDKAINIINKINLSKAINKENISKSSSERIRKNWINGVYDNVEHKFNRTKWYNYDRYGINIKLQGTWEIELAKKLDELNIKWICHSEIKERFIYIGLDGKNHSYKPDFKIVGTNIYLDPHWDFSEFHIHKFNEVKNKYDIDLKLLKSLNEIKNFIL